MRTYFHYLGVRSITSMLNQTKTDAQKISREIRYHILEMAYRSKTGHIGPALSIADILTVLYFKILNIRPSQPDWPKRDRFILSKGHASAALYAVLALKGVFPKEILKYYRVDKGKLHSHPCSHDIPGIEFSTGSLGHGLPVAAGIALGLKNEQIVHIYTLLGDGECNEGSVWEAANFIANNNLNNITAVIDHNGFQGFSATAGIDNLSLVNKWLSFGWRVLEVDGHNHKQIEQALITAKQDGAPTVIISRTVNGKGLPIIEDTLLSHYYVLDDKDYQEVLKIYHGYITPNGVSL